LGNNKSLASHIRYIHIIAINILIYISKMSLLDFGFTSSSIVNQNDTPNIPSETLNHVNTKVWKVLQNNQRGKYRNLAADEKLHIAKYSEQFGVQRASDEFGISKSSIYEWKIKYSKAKEIFGPEIDDAVVIGLNNENKGRPVLLGEMDLMVQEYLLALRAGGTPITRPIVKAAITAISEHYNKQSLAIDCGYISNNPEALAQSILRRMRWVRRRKTSSRKKVTQDEIKIEGEKYHKRIDKLVEKYHTAPELIINFDETGTHIIPVSHGTLAPKGISNVKIVAGDDKRMITVILGCTLSGSMLPSQVIYHGKTARCQAPASLFPDSWNITHQNNHWSNYITKIEYINQILIPYSLMIKKENDYPKSMRTILIYDHHTSNFHEDVQRAFRDNGFASVLVPACMTDEYQPLDRCGINIFKKTLNKSFNIWYSNEIGKQMDNGINVNDIQVDLSLSRIKPLHASWMLRAYNSIKKEHILSGWKLAGFGDSQINTSTQSEEIEDDIDEMYSDTENDEEKNLEEIGNYDCESNENNDDLLAELELDEYCKERNGQSHDKYHDDIFHETFHYESRDELGEEYQAHLDPPPNKKQRYTYVDPSALDISRYERIGGNNNNSNCIFINNTSL
jgi:hypothetical protein